MKYLAIDVDNRGTKSTTKVVVKAQRINGNQHTSMFKIYSAVCLPELVTGKMMSRPFLSNIKSIAKDRSISSLSNGKREEVVKESPNWLVGLVDAEGCFRISILKNKESNYKIRLYFQISLHIKDEKVLELMIDELKVGKIYRNKSRPDASELQISSIKEMKLIVDYFDRQSLLSQKYADYLLFKEAYLLISNKEHLTRKGLEKLVSLKASSNWGLSKDLKEIFPEVEPAPRLHPDTWDITDGWLRGFVSGEGNFMVRIIESKTHKLGYQVGLRFRVTQHSKDRLLMESIKSYLNCGHISTRGEIIDYEVTTIKDIQEKIIPFFDKHTVLGVKYEDFQDFKLATRIISCKEHLTEGGISNLREIKSKMNRQRDILIGEIDSSIQ